MDQDNKPTGGASADDTTSALFVSARKKQLEQQEADRRAKEKEEQRLAAEAEVRRLEQEVEERRRQAEAEARRIEQESLARQAQAAANANAAPGAWPPPAQGAPMQPPPMQPPPMQPPPMQKGSPPSGAFPGPGQPRAPGTGVPSGPNAGKPAGGNFFSNLLGNKKLLLIIGGAVVVVILVIVLIIALGGRGGSSGSPDPSPAETSGSGRTEPSSPAYTVFGYYYLNGDAGDDSLFFYSDGTMEIYYRGNGSTEAWDFSVDGNKVTILGTVYGVEDYYLTILDNETLVDQFGDTYSAAVSNEEYPWESDVEYHDLNSKIYFRYPTDWQVSQQPGASTVYAPVRVTQSSGSQDMMLIYNYTPEFHEFMRDGRSGMDNLIIDFAQLYFWDRDWDTDDLYNINFGDSYFNWYGNEVIVMTAENDYEYFAFVIVKKFTDPQQLVAVAIEATSQAVVSDFIDVAGSMDLQD